MDVQDKQVRDWFEALVPKIAQTIGKSSKKLSYELSVPNDSFYLSSLFFLKLKFVDEDPMELVVKRLPFNEAMSEAMKADILFHNEIVFYRDFAPHFDNNPKYIHGEEKPPHDTVIVLENVNSAGYKTASVKVNIPLDYTVAAVRALGRFHAQGYILKDTQKEEFFKLLEGVQDSRFEEQDEKLNQMIPFLNAMTPRAVKYLRKTGYDATFCDKVEPVMEQAFYKIMVDAAKPVEPLSTLCHGDYTMNNILFKEAVNGDLHAMPIDFALIRYGTPAIDLSTILLLCCSGELRKQNLELILRAYHDSLMECLREAKIENLQRFSYEAIYEDYKRRALFGFVITTFFLPICLGFCTLPIEDMVCMDYAELAEINGDLGGDEMSQTLADMLLELKDLGSLDHILQEN